MEGHIGDCDPLLTNAHYRYSLNPGSFRGNNMRLACGRSTSRIARFALFRRLRAYFPRVEILAPFMRIKPFTISADGANHQCRLARNPSNAIDISEWSGEG